MSTVLAIGDTHCPAMRKGYVDFLKRIADKYSPNRIVHIGDLVDWHSISYHERLPTVANAKTEYKLAKKQVHQLAEAFPKVDWLMGNHDSLIERQATTVGLPPEVLLDQNSLWEIDWKVHPRYSTILIDKTIYKHGDSGRGGQDAAYKQAQDHFSNVVLGHFHYNAGAKWFCNEAYRVFGLSTGCGIDRNKIQFYYGRKETRKPILGCGVVVNGKQAYFEPWLLPSR